MSWDRFHYICRRIARQSSVAPQALVADATLAQHGHWYGPPLIQGQLPGKLLAEMLACADDDAVRRCASLYVRIRPEDGGATPMARLASTVSYTAVLLLLLLVSGAIYRIRVLPVFESVYAMNGFGAVQWIHAYLQYFDAIALMLVLAMAAGLLMLLRIRDLFVGWGLAVDAPLTRLLLGRRIGEASDRLVDLLRFPLTRLGQQTALSPIQLCLREAEVLGLAVDEEINHLLSVHSRQLYAACERRLRIMMALVGGGTVLAIAGFVVAAYLPIFYLGETL